MALKAVPIKPVEAHRLDDPRRPDIPKPEPPVQNSPRVVAEPSAQPTPTRARRQPRPTRSPTSDTSAAPATISSATNHSAATALVNPYAHGGRPHQVAVSLYVPQWERIEEQCAELRAQGVRDATVTRWLFAVLHFRAPHGPDAAAELLRRWGRLEANDESPYFGLRKEARGVRFFESLWDQQRALITEIRHTAGQGRPTLAVWTAAVVELSGPKTAAEARDILRELRVLLAGDPE